MSGPLEHLPERIGDALKPSVDEPRVHRLWRGTQQRLYRPPVGRRYAMAAALLIVSTATSFYGSRMWDQRRFLRLEGGDVPVAQTIAHNERPRSLRFADSSAIELQAGSKLVPLRNDRADFETELERGRARFVVTPGRRRWQVQLGIAQVEVTGTIFSVERTPQRVVVAVERGSVRVVSSRFERGARALNAGEQVTLQISEAPQASQLMQRADQARASGHPERAVAALQRLLDLHPDDPQAPLAALLLGRIEMDQLQRPARAKVALQRALQLGLPQALRADVHQRLGKLEQR